MKKTVIILGAIACMLAPQWAAACSPEAEPDDWGYHRSHPSDRIVGVDGILTFQGSTPGAFHIISTNLKVEVVRKADQTPVTGRLEPGPAVSWVHWVPEVPLQEGETYSVRTILGGNFGAEWEREQFDIFVGEPDSRPAIGDYESRIEAWNHPILGDCLPEQEFPCGGCEREVIHTEQRWRMVVDFSPNDIEEHATLLVRVGLGVDVEEAVQVEARTPFAPMELFEGQFTITLDGSAIERWPSHEACAAMSVASPDGTLIFEATHCLTVPQADPNALLGRGGFDTEASAQTSGGCSAMPGSQESEFPILLLLAMVCLFGLRRRNRLSQIGLSLLLIGLSGCGFGNTDDGLCLPGLSCDKPPTIPPPIEQGRTLPQLKRADTAPAPISGGTMALTTTGSVAVVADPAREKVFILALESREKLATIEVDGEPGRVHIDKRDQFAYVANRRGSTVFRFDLTNPGEHSMLDVCQSPRGLALDEAGLLFVACQTGILQVLNPESGQVHNSFFIEDDLRDVIINESRIFVTRFRSAELLEISGQGEIVSRRTPPELSAREETKPTKPNVAWRTIAMDDGRVLMLHQRAQLSPVDIARNPVKGGYGSINDSMCGESIVQSALTVFEIDGSATHLGIMADAVLTTDVAFNAETQEILVAAAGNSETPFAGIQRSAIFIGLNDEPAHPDTGFRISKVCLGQEFIREQPRVQGELSSIAFSPTIGLLAFDRASGNIVDFNGATVVELSNDDIFDTGHDLFHKDAGAGIACASCHPEGGDDSHTWLFTDLGLRRTQTLRGGLKGTEPFHWEGDMPDFSALTREVMGRRMGGPQLNHAYSSALLDWLDTLPSTAQAPTEAAAVERGRILYHDGVVGCASCHSGAQLTNNLNYDVGTGGIFQVPTLKGIASRAPFMHDGCADSLELRFTDCGGGDAHGQTSHLNGGQIADLVEYMKTL